MAVRSWLRQYRYRLDRESRTKFRIQCQTALRHALRREVFEETAAGRSAVCSSSLRIFQQGPDGIGQSGLAGGEALAPFEGGQCGLEWESGLVSRGHHIR